MVKRYFCALTALLDGLKHVAAVLFHAVRGKTKTNQDSLAIALLRLGSVTWTCTFRALIGSLSGLRPLWLSRLITLVLHNLIENGSELLLIITSVNQGLRASWKSLNLKVKIQSHETLRKYHQLDSWKTWSFLVA